MTSVGNNGGAKITLSLPVLVTALLLGFIGWAATLVWTKADGAAPKEDVKLQEQRIQELRMDQVLMKRDLQQVQADTTETKSDVKAIKGILERRYPAANAAPSER